MHTLVVSSQVDSARRVARLARVASNKLGKHGSFTAFGNPFLMLSVNISLVYIYRIRGFEVSGLRGTVNKLVDFRPCSTAPKTVYI